MIIFLDNPDLIGVISSHFNRPIEVFNLSSLYSGFKGRYNLTKLITEVTKITNPFGVESMPIPDYVNSIEFDMYYMSFIFENGEIFEKFMYMMSSAYEGNIVVILIQRDIYRDAITEALIKIIQQRYGYNCWLISDIEDIFSIRESTFTPMGLTVLQGDLAKFDQMSQFKGICVE